MPEVIATPVICEHRPLDSRFGRDIYLAPGETLRISARGVEAFGWSITLRQLYLALQDAAASKRYEVRP